MTIHAYLTACLLLLSSFAITTTIAATPIDLGSAANFVILAGSTVTSTGVIGTVVTGDIGVNPGTAVTGFPPAILNGAMQLGNGVSLAAQNDLTTAYNMAAGLPFNTTLSNIGMYPFEC